MTKCTRTGNGCRNKKHTPSASAQAARIIESICKRRAAGDRAVVLSDYRPDAETWVELARQLNTAEYTDLIR